MENKTMSDKEFEVEAQRNYASFQEDLQQGMERLQKARGQSDDSPICEDCSDSKRRDVTVKYRKHSNVWLCFTCLNHRSTDETWALEDERNAILDRDEDTDDDEEELEDEDDIYNEYDALSVEKVITIDITLGTGGPARGFTLTLDSDGDVDSGEFWYQDWFTARRTFKMSQEEIDRALDLYRIDPSYYISDQNAQHYRY
jgi:hypothetical protein